MPLNKPNQTKPWTLIIHIGIISIEKKATMRQEPIIKLHPPEMTKTIFCQQKQKERVNLLILPFRRVTERK